MKWNLFYEEVNEALCKLHCLFIQRRFEKNVNIWTHSVHSLMNGTQINEKLKKQKQKYWK